MIIHPKARPVISTLTLPSPIKKYFSQENWDIDLSSNTNPHLGYFAQYPDVKQEELKEIYLYKTLSLNPVGIPKEKGTLSSENVLFTVGSMEGIDLILRTFSEPNKDKICVVSPTFPAYEHWARIHNLEVISIPLLGNNLTQFSIDDIVAKNPKIVFICDPNNPIGTRVEPGLIKTLCDCFEGLVIVDEAYIEFSESSSSINYLTQYKNLIILRTFSKAWGLAGIRCGVILAHKTTVNALRYIQLPFGVSTFSQLKVRERLVHSEKTLQSWHKIKKDRTFLIQELSNMKNVSKVFPSETNFLFMILNSFQKAMESLRNNRIQVFDCSKVVPHSIRVSIGTEKQNRKFLEALH